MQATLRYPQSHYHFDFSYVQERYAQLPQELQLFLHFEDIGYGGTVEAAWPKELKRQTGLELSQLGVLAGRLVRQGLITKRSVVAMPNWQESNHQTTSVLYFFTEEGYQLYRDLQKQLFS